MALTKAEIARRKKADIAAATAATKTADKLSREQLAEEYKSAVGIIYNVPELTPLFEQAVNENWTADKFKAAVQSSNWYRNNSEPARLAFARKAIGGADWADLQAIARQTVQQTATNLGVVLTPEQLDGYTQRYVYEGWDAADRKPLMTKALSEDIKFTDKGSLKGLAGNLQDTLKKIAVDNGLRLSDSYYKSAAVSVASGLQTKEDWERDVRDQAASLWPSYSEKIKAGVDVASLASGYVNTMAQTLEINPQDINLNDPYIREALGNFDDKGNPAPLGLWDFEKKLRADPRWMNTKQATDETSSVANTVLKMFGFRG
jgi:hypothetical protein